MKFKQKRSGSTAPIFSIAPSARLEHATYCSASKRSNPLSYEGKQGGILTRLDMTVKSGKEKPLRSMSAHITDKLRHKRRIKVSARLAFDIVQSLLP